MMNPFLRPSRAFKFLSGLATMSNLYSRRFDELQASQGRILANLNRNGPDGPLTHFEFKVFSQWGEDGIIQRLVDKTTIRNRTFIEFGVEDFSESNCRFLMMNDNWQGFVIDGSETNMNRLKSSYYYWRHDLQAHTAFITRENINSILENSGFDHDLGILSVDIDGVDYWVLEAITSFRPAILIVEYNSVFGCERAISVPYDPSFQRTRKHHSNLYWGASLPAFAFLCEKKGYSLVGTASAGGNAFFVRNDLLTLPSLSVQEAFTTSRYRESLDENGKPTFLRGAERLKVVSGLPVINVLTGAEERL